MILWSWNWRWFTKFYNKNKNIAIHLKIDVNLISSITFDWNNWALRAKLCFVVLDSLMFLKLINHSMLVFACSSFSFFSVMMSTSMSNLSKWWTLFVISILSTEVSLMLIFLREKWILHQLQSTFGSENDQNDLSALLFILAQKWCM